MGCQAILADIDAVDEAGRNHPPADGALQAAESEQRQQSRLEVRLQHAGEPEKNERQREHGADQPPEQAVGPFPPVDELEAGKRHVGIHLAEFRNLAVFGEFLLPLGFVQRRDDAVDRLPFGDR